MIFKKLFEKLSFLQFLSNTFDFQTDKVLDMSTPAIPSFDFQDPRQTEGFKAITRLADTIQEYVKFVDSHREQQIRADLTKFPLDFKEKQKEFEINCQSFTTKDARKSYLLNRLHQYEHQMQVEKLGPKLEAILNDANGDEVYIAKELSKISCPFPQIIAYLMNRAMVRWLKHYSTFICAAELLQPCTNALVESGEQAEQLQSTVPPLQNPAKAPVAQPKTKEDILRALQGLPSHQQLLNREEVMIVLGIKKSTLSNLQKSGAFPSPVRINGKGRGAKYKLEEVMQTLTTSRQKSKFKPRQ